MFIPTLDLKRAATLAVLSMALACGNDRSDVDAGPDDGMDGGPPDASDGDEKSDAADADRDEHDADAADAGDSGSDEDAGDDERDADAADAGDGGSEEDAGPKPVSTFVPGDDVEYPCEDADACGFPKPGLGGGSGATIDGCVGNEWFDWETGTGYQIKCNAAQCYCYMRSGQLHETTCEPSVATTAACNPQDENQCCGLPYQDGAGLSSGSASDVHGTTLSCFSNWMLEGRRYRTSCSSLNAEDASCTCTELTWDKE